MKRNKLLVDGEYTGLPLRVLKTTRLNPTAKLVFAALINRLGVHEDTYPSQALIAEDCNLSIRSVKYAIAQLKNVGLISYRLHKTAADRFAVNHYVLNDSRVLDDVSLESSPPDTTGKACPRGKACTKSDMPSPPETTGKACPQLVQSLPLISAKLAPGTNKRTNKGTNKFPACGREPPAAAERDKQHPPSLAKDVGWLELLKVWKRQHRPLPPPAKLETCRKLLAIQQKQTGETFDASVIESGIPLDFENLFKRTHTKKYYWQELGTIAAVKLESKQVAQSLKQVKAAELDQAEQIYAAYPRQLKKVAAIKEIRLAMKRLQALDASQDAGAYLLERTKLFAASPEGQKGRYTPYPQNWFRDGRYGEDEKEWYASENRSGSLKREVVKQDETPGETFQDFVKRTHKN